MKKGLLIIICLIALFVSSCGPRLSSDMKTEEREVAAFTSVEINAPVDLVISIQPGAATTLKLKGFPDILKRLTSEVNGDILRLNLEGDFEWNFDEATRVEIVVGSLSALALGGATDAKINGNITGDAFSLSVAGDADVVIAEINTDKLSVEAAGKADIEIMKGVVRYAEYSFAGAADLKAYGLQSSDVSAAISGAGDIKVNVSQTLSASISGVGDVHYKGKPSVTQDISGLGDVVDAN